ncbi:hypothetical protein N9D80_03440, partial [Flavobacteriales bacterium]|nr:hypothetical protein [Flavobacteriales bacterium]
MFVGGGVTAGCTDSTATNYDPLAGVDDGSCTYPCLDNEITLNMIDSYGDGWNGNYFVLTNSAGTVVMNSTIVSGSSGSELACLPDDCYTISWINGSFMTEVSWNITDASGTVLASGGAPGSGLLDLGGLCALGCTDPGASNYDPLANVDDGSCTYANCSNVTLSMVDSYGDGWNGNVFEMSNSAGIVVMSSTLATGLTGVDSACIADDCYTITCGGGSWAAEVSWTLIDDATGNVLASGGSPYTGAAICLPAVFGCMDMFADNYDSLATISSGCLYTGCTDAMATNYCASCNVNDPASCVYPVANSLDFCDNFEANNLSANGWTTITGSEAGQFIGLTNANAIADTVSLESTGADVAAGWTAYSTEADAFANVSHVNSATILFDMSTQSGIVNLGLDYKTESYFSPLYSSMRVKVNGNVVTDINGVSWHSAATLTSLTYDLSSNAGDSAVYVTIETACKYSANYSIGTYGDFVWVDNICAYAVTPCTNYGVAADYSFDVSCNGGSDGMASVTSFGDAVFNQTSSYDWTDATGVSIGTGASVSGLSAGTYTCTATDVTNGCSASTSVTIGEPTAVTASGFVLDATSPINSDGSVTLSSSGGSPCFTGANDTLATWDGGTEYVWSGIATGMTNYFDITAVSACGITGFDVTGVYTTAGNIEIWTRTGTSNGYTTDAAGWTLNTSIPNTATVNGVTVYVPLMSAIGMDAGDITGIAIYTPGDHYMTLGGSDAYSTALASDANISVSTGFMCANGSAFNGADTYGGIAQSSNISGNVYYTSPEYTYAWSNGATTQNVSNLGMGPISVTVTDCNGCTGTWSGFVAANIINGCTDPNASNFDPLANTDDGSCTYPGC